jgi:hypothetical protein
MQRGCLVESIRSLRAVNGTSNENNSGGFSDNMQNTTVMDTVFNFPSHFADALYQREYCHSYSLWQVFWYNYICVLVFFLGLNFTHMGKTPLSKINLKIESIKKFTKGIWIAFIVILLITAANFGYAFYLYAQSGILFMYLTVMALELGFVIIVSLILRKTHYFHFHHYVWGCFIMMLTGYQNIYISMLSFLVSGIMIEGVSRWGCDRWWYLKH